MKSIFSLFLSVLFFVPVSISAAVADDDLDTSINAVFLS